MASARPPQSFRPDARASDAGAETAADRAPAQASQSPAASPTPSPTRSATPSATPTPQPSSHPDETPPGDLSVSTSSRELLVQVGDVIHYRVTVTNPGPDNADDVAIHNDVPPEVDVISVPISPRADAIQLGRTPDGEDIDWVINDLGAGRSVTFTWTGRAAVAGDLAALNRVQARGANRAATSDSSETFLGVREGVTTDNPKPQTITKKVVVFGTRIVSGAPGAPGSILPVTGFDPSRFLSLAGLMVAGGLCLIAIARMQNRRLSWTVTSIALVAIMTACVSTPDEPSARPQPDTTSPVEGDEAEDEPKDRVKGTRIVREGAEDLLDETDDDVAAPPVSEAPVVETVRSVRIVEIAPEDLAVTELDSRLGDNAMSYTWDEDAGITQAASSIRFGEDQPANIITSLSVGARGIDVDVTITNLSDDKRLSMHGRIVHIVSGTSGEIARFESEEIDLVLEPNGSTTVSFEYLLPSGDYGASSAFEAS
jgi:uncharacterized repeat protein (TIGR01451 family)